MIIEVSLHRPADARATEVVVESAELPDDRPVVYKRNTEHSTIASADDALRKFCTERGIHNKWVRGYSMNGHTVYISDDAPFVVT